MIDAKDNIEMKSPWGDIQSDSCNYVTLIEYSLKQLLWMQSSEMANNPEKLTKEIEALREIIELGDKACECYVGLQKVFIACKMEIPSAVDILEMLKSEKVL